MSRLFAASEWSWSFKASARASVVPGLFAYAWTYVSARGLQTTTSTRARVMPSIKQTPCPTPLKRWFFGIGAESILGQHSLKNFFNECVA